MCTSSIAEPKGARASDHKIKPEVGRVTLTVVGLAPQSYKPRMCISLCVPVLRHSGGYTGNGPSADFSTRGDKSVDAIGDVAHDPFLNVISPLERPRGGGGGELNDHERLSTD